MEFVNLCPHAISVMGADGEVKIFPPSGSIARVAAKATPIAPIAGFSVSVTVYGDVTGLPAPEAGKVFIVSGVVLEAVKAVAPRPDVVAPDTGPTQVRFTADDEAAGLGKAGQTRYVMGFRA